MGKINALQEALAAGTSGIRWLMNPVGISWRMARMRPVFFFFLSAVAGCMAVALPALAGKADEAKYPLRVHILRFVAQPNHSREPHSLTDPPPYVAGMGAADLFENGEPQGFQFTYSCTASMEASGAYSTLPARWKKKDKTLEILLPQAGKPWNSESCNLQVEMRPGLVYYWKDGAVAEEPAAVLKGWMVKHRYDPENGREEPVMAPGESAEGDPQIAGPD
jgi:hypothetical protein